MNKYKELIVGFILLGLGIGMLFFKQTAHIGPFLIGFSVPTIIRGSQSNQKKEKKKDGKERK